jgi:hypothetical protein
MQTQPPSPEDIFWRGFFGGARRSAHKEKKRNKDKEIDT